MCSSILKRLSCLQPIIAILCYIVIQCIFNLSQMDNTAIIHSFYYQKYIDIQTWKYLFLIQIIMIQSFVIPVPRIYFFQDFLEILERMYQNLEEMLPWYYMHSAVCFLGTICIVLSLKSSATLSCANHTDFNSEAFTWESWTFQYGSSKVSILFQTSSNHRHHQKH